MRTRSTAARMARLVAQWRESEETEAGLARRHGIPPWTFWYWCRKLMAPSGPPSDRMFVPVRVTEADATPVLEIVLSGGDRVQVRSGASVDLLQATIRAQRAAEPEQPDQVVTSHRMAEHDIGPAVPIEVGLLGSGNATDPEPGREEGKKRHKREPMPHVSCSP